LGRGYSPKHQARRARYPSVERSETWSAAQRQATLRDIQAQQKPPATQAVCKCLCSRMLGLEACEDVRALGLAAVTVD
jgi:hypothetical protein